MNKIAIVFAAAIMLLPSMKSEAQEKSTGKKPKVVAHRGYWNCPEAGYAKNSLAAFRCALEEGFWGSEFDVNITKDGRLVVYHDAKAEGLEFNTHDFKDFSSIRLANGEPIPEIDAFLKLALEYPGTRLIYELKSQSSKEFDRKLVDITKAKLEEYGLLDPSRVTFISFNFDVCRWLSEELPGFNVQFLGVKKPAKVHRAGVNGISTNHMVLKTFPDWVKKAQSLGMTVNCWTVNDKDDMLRMAGLGVDLITTDNPVILREVIADIK